MSVSMWSYRPEVCDGGGCPGDCDLCDKPKNMEDEDDDTMSLFVDSLSYGEEMLLDLGKAPQEIIGEVFYYDE